MGYRRYYRRRNKNIGGQLIGSIAVLFFLYALKESNQQLSLGETISLFFSIFLGVLILALILKLSIKAIKKSGGIYKGYNSYEVVEDERAREHYEYKGLMVKNERIFYKVLNNVLHKEYGNRYTVLCQVRMADLFDKKFNSAPLINQSLDFLIIDLENDFDAVVAIELDGESHNYEHQKDLDERKEKILSISPISLVRVENEDNYDEKIIYKLIIPYLAPLKSASIFSSIFGNILGKNNKEEKIEISNISDYGKSQNGKKDNEIIYESNYIENEQLNGGYQIKKEKTDYKNLKLGLEIGLGLAFFFTILVLGYYNIKSRNDNQILFQTNNQNKVALETVQQETIQQPIIAQDHIDIEVKNGNNSPCQSFIDEDKKNGKTSNKFTCTSNIFYSNYLGACVKNEKCEYTNNEKRYYIHNLSEGGYIFSCYEDIDGKRKIYKIINQDIRDIVWPGEKSCNSLYAEIYRNLHKVNDDVLYN